jgi:hypothetical protein
MRRPITYAPAASNDSSITRECTDSSPPSTFIRSRQAIVSTAHRVIRKNAAASSLSIHVAGSSCRRPA